MNKYKILFFITLISILILSVTPHPNSEVTQQSQSIQEELIKLGNVAYIGEEFIGEFSDKYRHFIAFWVLAILLDLSYGFKTIYKLLFLLFYGIFIESAQYYLPYRDFDIFDIVFNTLFILLYFIFTRLLFNSFYKRMFVYK